jgi:D-glycero-alpha-D-manno-heptose-7-phosphate kinase
MEHLLAMRDQAKELRALLQNGFDPKAFAGVLDAGWQLKRQLASSITNDRIDLWHRRAMEAGALGGKLCGAGGGGFLLFVVAPDRQEAVRQALSDLTEIRVGYEAHGSSLLFVE